jgi:hypothetical protein
MKPLVNDSLLRALLHQPTDNTLPENSAVIIDSVRKHTSPVSHTLND